MDIIKKFMSYYKPHYKLFILDIFCACSIAGLDLVTPRFSSILLDDIIPQKDLNLLLNWCFILIIIYGIRVFLQYIVEYYGHVLGVKIEYDMRKKLFFHIQKLPISFFDNYKVGKLMSRLVNDLNDITEVAHHGPEDLLISIVLLVGSFVLMYQSNLILALVMTLLVPLMIYFGVKKNLRFRKAFKSLKSKMANINAQAEDNFSGIRVVKAFNAEEHEAKLFDQGNHKFTVARKTALKTMAEFGVSVKFFVYLIQLIVFILGGYLIINEQLTIGGLMEFMLYIQLFQQPITKISAFIMQFNQGMAGFERFLDILDIPVQEEKADAYELENVVGNISFENVSFSYNEKGKEVLTNLNLDIKAKETVALVGYSGGGKTTICNLIPRFYDIKSGTIKIDGHNINDVTLNSLRANIGIVQQEVFIFGGTIFDNVLYGKIQATKEEVIEACKKANAHEFIMELENGYDTYIGERGVKLSGGQKQRLAIARIFLKNPKILILDEATSALDNRNEKIIQNTLAKLSENRTTIVVAHRLTTIQNASLILVIGENGIEEQGTHQQLIEKNGLYAKLWKGVIN